MHTRKMNPWAIIGGIGIVLLLIGLFILSQRGCGSQAVSLVTATPERASQIIPSATPASANPSEPTSTPVVLGPAPATTAPKASPAAPPTISSRSKPPRTGSVAYDFTLEDIDGNQVSLSDFRGEKVMLNFWATWCAPCRAEIPHMVKLYGERHGEGFEIVAVNLREGPERVGPFAERLQMEFPVLLDKTGKVGRAYFVRGIPTSIFLDENGVIQAIHVGTLTDENLRRYVADLLD